MSECYAISRVASYKFSDCGGVLKEALRTLPNYDNPDCDPLKSYLNVALVECNLQGLSPEKYILKYREDNNIKGRFNTSATNPKNLTNVMCQALFTTSKEYLDNMTRDEQIEFFELCLEFFRKKFPSVHIASAIIHFDETTPHMHVTFLPTVERIRKKTGEKETIFSTTELMPGKDFYQKYQDEFFAFITSHYDGFSRGKSNRKNLSVEDYKEFCRLKEKLALAMQQLNTAKKLLDRQKEHIAFLSGELEKVQNDKKWFESIPLIGEFFKILRNMKADSIEAVLKECIAVAHEEEEYIAQQEKSVDDILFVATEKSKTTGLSDKKKSIVQALFGNNPTNDFTFDK